ncbi:MAG: hypothetical protein ACXADS_02125 [Candidatus Thorarchaeota archaeon]
MGSVSAMKPVGTITKYYQFLDEGTARVLDSVMREARNYHDFVVRLGERVYYEDVSAVLAHIAAVHAWELREIETIDRIIEKCGALLWVKPWTYPIRGRGDRLAVSHKIQDAINDAIGKDPEDWILMELYLLSAYALIHVPEYVNALDAAKALLERVPELGCFEPYIHHLDARGRYEQGDAESGVPICEMGLVGAKECDDIYQTCWLLRWSAIITMESDVRRALQFLEEAYDLAKFLGSMYHVDAVLKEMGWVSTILGEYDLALKFHFEGARVYDSPEGPSDRHAVVVSRIYSDLNKGEDALEWAKWSLDWHRNLGSEGDTYTHLEMARSLILLRRLEEAVEHLDIAREIAFKSGLETEICWYYHVTGLHEMTSGDTLTAVHSLEKALEISERVNAPVYTNRCLIALVRAEIAASTSQNGNKGSDVSGPWMSRLEEHACKKDLPGILMQQRVLKAEFLMAQGRKEEARKILVDALEIYDSPGVRTLQQRILEMIGKLDAMPPDSPFSLY